MKLQTHPGIGLITSLALVHTLEPVSRFSTARKLVAYVGPETVEHSSAERKRFGSISKEGCRFFEIPDGRDGTEGVQRRSGVEGFLLPPGAEEREIESESGGSQKAPYSRLHYAARRDRLCGVPASRCRRTVRPGALRRLSCLDFDWEAGLSARESAKRSSWAVADARIDD
jgi:Transposase IS116/IS110/IS902 family